MKGITWNGSHFAEKGTSRSEGTNMFSVGGLVAFSYKHYCSPDGRSHSSGCCPATTSYLLQEEVVLEEYDRTISSRYGSGKNDIKKIVVLIDRFWHGYDTQVSYKTFLLQILESDKNVFNNFIDGDIAEVRNNPGKYLHIYEVPENYRSCLQETFEATVETINLQKKQEDEFETEKIAKSYRGVELIFGITSSGWYASTASFGKHSVQPQHEHDSTSRQHYKLVIMPCVPNGYYQFHTPGGTPISLSLSEGSYPSISVMTNTHWANSQNWDYSEIEKLSIGKGWIFIDGEDVHTCTKRTIEENAAKKILARKEKFENVQKVAIEAGFIESQIFELTKIAAKGKVIAFLHTAVTIVKEYKFEPEAVVEIMKELKGEEVSVVQNYAAIVCKRVSVQRVHKTSEKAFAWAYLRSAIPEVNFTGYFDDAKRALELFAERNPFSEVGILQATVSLGEIAGSVFANLKSKLDSNN